MTIEALNGLDEAQLKTELTKCCGAANWVAEVAAKSPFANEGELLEVAVQVWEQCAREDYLEAFRYHPKIGDINSLKEKFNNTKKWAGDEQSGVNTASEDTLVALKEGNEAYEEKFGYIFIVCATGKSADEMLGFLNERLGNDPEYELGIAAREQMKITEIRLKKLLS